MYRGSALCLAVLHPKKLSVYTIQAMGSSFLNLVKAYEHSLVHTAANLAYGPFGGDQGEQEHTCSLFATATSIYSSVNRPCRTPSNLACEGIAVLLAALQSSTEDVCY